MKKNFKINDKVIIISGKNRKKTGIIIGFVRKKNNKYVIIKDINLVTKHVKPNAKKNISGGKIKKESPIHISNISILKKNK